MDIVDKKLVAEFVVESQEGLANVENQMLSIEAAGADIDTDLVNSVFRTMHSIKGASGFLGLDRIGSLAHGLEEILNNLRNREMIPTTELVSTMLRAADFMKGLIDEVESSNEADVAPYISELQQFRPGVQDTESPASQTTAPSAAEAAPAATIAATTEPSATLNDATREFLIECYENLDQMDHDLLQIERDPTAGQLLRNVFRTVHTIKGGAGFLGLTELERLAHAAEDLLGKLRSGERTFNSTIGGALLASADKLREGLRLVESSSSDAGLNAKAAIAALLKAQCVQTDPPTDGSPAQGTGEPIDAVPKSNLAQQQHPPTVSMENDQSIRIGDILVKHGKALPHQVEEAIAQQRRGDPLQVGEILVEKGIVLPQDVREAVAALQDSKASALVDTSIRVDVGLLDKLMTRVGELVLARNQILQHTSKQDDSKVANTAQRLNLITTELQESVMKTRMQPIGNVWAKFPRVVRDLSTQLGKQVRIEMEGKETELDRTIIESIKDPLTHLVRNSVDHGIENPEARTAAGKPPEGILMLRAYHEGGQVNIEISDDGAGLNLDRVRNKAVEGGLVSPDQAARMTERDAAQLILLPGFSTAERVTAVSGRGVGMDVVKTNIERIGGTLDLQSQTGQGTTIKLKIPLTLAIIPALVVTCGGDRYAIPQVSLLELLRLDEGQTEKGIEFVHGAPVYRLRGKLLPLVYLSESIGLSPIASAGEAADGNRINNIVVLRTNDRQFGLVVDKILDTEEIVVKPLSRQLKGLREYAGATIMGDGTVALILDVMGLALRSGLVDEMREQVIAHSLADDSKSSRTLETLLVVDLGDARRFAMPTSLVARLERVSRSAVEYVDGREVIQYRGAILPLVKLVDVFGPSTAAVSAGDDFQIVVYADENRQCGLVVNRIVDIVATELHMETRKGPNEYLLGTAIIQQRATNLLNLQRLARFERENSVTHAPAS
jgi:two-component system, chemotaxis family, sensor kinase CheA